MRKIDASAGKTGQVGRTVYVPDGESYKVLLSSRLMVVKGDDHGHELTVEKERVTIGRSASCDLVLSDPAVSSLHAELITEEHGRLVRDLDSKNGVYFMGHRVNELYLQPGSCFQIGKDQLRFDPLDEERKIPFSRRDHFGQALGRSVKMREIFAVLEKAATSELPVLLCGETGTGKEFLASAIHNYSLRKKRPFIVLDCGALASGTVESTLLGHERGAFTGAEDAHQGVFEQADGGTLFIDEVGDLRPDLQPKLLRALQEQEIKRIGSVGMRKVDVRVVAATNRDLHRLVDEGIFREDLLYRLSVFEVQVPPLRERLDDIPFLAEHFLAEGNQVRGQFGQDPVRLDEEALDLLNAHPWPGNVRELRNVIERTVYLAEGEVVGRHNLMMDMLNPDSGQLMALDQLEPYKMAKARLLAKFERRYLITLLKINQGNLTRAAKQAGLVRHHLRDLCRKYEIPCGRTHD